MVSKGKATRVLVLEICLLALFVPLLVVGGVLMGARRDAARYDRFAAAGIPIEASDDHTVRIAIAGGTLYLSTGRVRIGRGENPFTAMEATHATRSPLAFTIVRRGWGNVPDPVPWFQAKSPHIVLREIVTGDPWLDSYFCVRSNDETVVRSLLANTEIRRLLLEQTPAVFGALPANTKLWPLTCNLYPRQHEGIPALLLADGLVIGDADRIKSRIALIEATREELIRLGVIA